MALVFIEFWLGERKSRCFREGNCIPALHVFVSPRSCIRVPSNLLSSPVGSISSLSNILMRMLV